MKRIFYLLCLLATVATATHGQTRTAMEETAKPVTCKLTTPALQKRKATILAELKALVLERFELENGYAYKFDGSDPIVDKLAEFIKSERMCCDFFTFQLTVEKNSAILNITGPPGTKVFLKEEADL